MHSAYKNIFIKRINLKRKHLNVRISNDIVLYFYQLKKKSIKTVFNDSDLLKYNLIVLSMILLKNCKMLSASL